MGQECSQHAGTPLRQAKNLARSTPSKHTASSAPALTLASRRATEQPHHLKFYLPGYFTCKPSTLSPAHTSLLGGKSMCVADASPTALQFWRHPGREKRRAVWKSTLPGRQWCHWCCLPTQKEHQNPANHKTSLKHLSLHMVSRRTAWNGTSWHHIVHKLPKKLHNLLSLSRPKEII